MRTWRSHALLALAWCCGCGSSQEPRNSQHPHANAGGTSGAGSSASGAGGRAGAAGGNAPQPPMGGAPDASNLGGRPADAGPPSDAAQDAAADAGRHAGGDACASGSCDPDSECDDDRPCETAEAVCIAGACAIDPEPPGTSWTRSIFAGRAGRVGDDDRTLWCVPAIELPDDGGPARVTSMFQMTALDGKRSDGAMAPEAAQRVRFQCFGDAERRGPSTVVTSPWSDDGQDDRVVARCPEARPYAGHARCQVAADAAPPFVYAGKVCGDGISGVTATPTLHGQLLGDHYELPGGTKPLFNDTGEQAAIVGSDLGYQFLAQGRMYVGFGDSWENDWTVPGPLAGYRGSVLAHTRDFDPADGDGIVFEGWDTVPGRPNVARDVIPSPHDQTGNTEFTAIGTSGFGLTDGGDGYRFLWFAAIKRWSPFTANEYTLAWSKNGEAFIRGDRAPEQHPPRWPFQSYFGTGATWVDREAGYVYFFGVRTYEAESPIRLARVRATLSSVLDHLEYEYWTGTSWEHPDPDDEYALARSPDALADLLPGGATQSTRPELSVAYNAHAGRFMMLVQNDRDGFTNEDPTEFQIWQAEAIEGPWTRVDTGDHLVLANNLYGPYMSEQTMVEGGREVYFVLSDWNLLPLAAGQPYVVGLWSMALERAVVPGCDP